MQHARHASARAGDPAGCLVRHTKPALSANEGVTFTESSAASARLTLSSETLLPSTQEWQTRGVNRQPQQAELGKDSARIPNIPPYQTKQMGEPAGVASPQKSARVEPRRFLC